MMMKSPNRSRINTSQEQVYKYIYIPEAIRRIDEGRLMKISVPFFSPCKP